MAFEYTTISSNDLVDFNAKCMELANDGWLPVGNIKVLTIDGSLKPDIYQQWRLTSETISAEQKLAEIAAILAPADQCLNLLSDAPKAVIDVLKIINS